MMNRYFCDGSHIFEGWYKYYVIIPSKDIMTCTYIEFEEVVTTLYKMYVHLIGWEDGEQVLRPNPIALFHTLKDVLATTDFDDDDIDNIYIGYKAEFDEAPNIVTYIPEAKRYRMFDGDADITNIEVKINGGKINE